MSIRNSLFLIGGMEIKSTFAAAVFCTNSVSISAGLDNYSRQATWGRGFQASRLLAWSENLYRFVFLPLNDTLVKFVF